MESVHILMNFTCRFTQGIFVSLDVLQVLLLRFCSLANYILTLQKSVLILLIYSYLSGNFPLVSHVHFKVIQT